MATNDQALQKLLAPLKDGTIPLPEGAAALAAHHEGDSFTTVRTATHRGKHIEIHTTYRIFIDGTPLTAHVTVLNDGTVHTHGLPQYSFASAVDMVRKVIDVFDVELPADELGDTHPPHHGDHEEH